MSQLDDAKYNVFTRRSMILGSGMMLLSSGLMGRMYYLQVVNGKKYDLLANENRISYRILPPQRGEIVDRFNRPIAINKTDYRVNIIPEQCDDVAKTLLSLENIFDISSNKKRKIFRAVKSQRAYLPVNVIDSLSWKDFAAVNVNLPSLPGVHPEVGTVRYYPKAGAISHLVGYVQSVSKKDLNGDPLLEQPGFKIGKNGLERTMEGRLRGEAGNQSVEVNSIGREIRELDRNESTAGEKLNLTIDIDIQSFVAERIKHESAAAVVMDIFTGEILSLVSMPTYDPNDFHGGISHKKWNALLADKRKPMLNKTVAGQYSPGSTYKMIVALAALKAGVVKESDKFFCNGHTEVGNQKFHCWQKRGHGSVNLIQGIEQSCDIVFYDIALKVGIDKISKMAEKFGFGHKFDIGIPGELTGINPNIAWKRRKLKAGWRGGDTANAAIGQGYVSVTPLQLCVMISRLVNGGLAVNPRIIAEDDDLELKEMDINPYHLKMVLQGMNNVMNNPRGTAYRHRIKNKEIAMGGKSGTTQVRRITLAERRKGIVKYNDRPWEHREHALFVGFAPVNNPRYAVSILVEHGGSGSSTAAPIARDILEYTMSRDPVLGQNSVFDKFKKSPEQGQA